MTSKRILRSALDLVLTILLLCAYAYRIIGDTAHKWVGVSVSALFIAHNIINGIKTSGKARILRGVS